jgi:hypothetical protein
MPNLSKSTVTTWLKEQEPTIATLWAGAIRPVEDDPDVRAALTELGEALDASLNRDAIQLSGRLREAPVQDGLRRVLAQLGPARQLRILHWLSFAGLPQAGEVLGGLLQDDPSGAGQMVRASIQELNRQELLARIFSRGRLQVLLAACQVQQAEAA